MKKNFTASNAPNNWPGASAFEDIERGPEEASLSELDFYAFPTVEQLQRATEIELREAGFGYRAKYVVDSAAILGSKPEGWQSLLYVVRCEYSSIDVSV